MAFSTTHSFLSKCTSLGLYQDSPSNVRVSETVSVSLTEGRRRPCFWKSQRQNVTTSLLQIVRKQSFLNGAFNGLSIASKSGYGRSSNLKMKIPAWKDDCCDPSRLHEQECGDEEDGSSFKPAAESDFINILEIIRGKGNWRYQKVKELKSLRLKVEPNLVLKVITQENVSPALAWKFFVWAKKQMGYRNTSETYNAMLQILCESRKFTSIFFVLEDMHEEDCSLTVETCMKMAKTFGRAGLVERALHSLNHMGRLGSPPTPQHYGSLVNVLLKSQHYFKAYIAYTEMVKNGCEADSHIFKLLIREFDRACKVDLASQLYNDMVVRGCEPDAETSSVLINVLCKACRVDDAVCLFEKMKIEGIRPNVSRYNTLIVYLGRDNKVEKALQLFDELRCLGCLPDNDTLSSLVESLRSCGRDEDAERCFQYSRSKEPPEGEGEE